MPDLYPFEKRIVEAEELNLIVCEDVFESSYMALCVDDVIIIDKRLSWTEKNCILAEETGHAIFNYGDITDQSISSNRKQERIGRTYAYSQLVSLDGLIQAYKYGCNNIYEAAEYLDVTVDFFKEAINTYLRRYGPVVTYKGYKFRFSEEGVCIEKRVR